MYRSLVHSGQLLIDGTTGKEKTNFTKKVKDYTDRYNKVCERAKDRLDKIEKVLPDVRDHNNNNKIVEDVIKQSEPVLQSIQPVGIQPVKGSEQGRKVKVKFHKYINFITLVHATKKNFYLTCFFSLL